ncbi:MAG: hypothetical protein LBT75_04735 [Bacilli bacterium]|jgi:hypothetical protein|nr:hypothetical protein [Bacilli bacterium]
MKKLIGIILFFLLLICSYYFFKITPAQLKNLNPNIGIYYVGLEKGHGHNKVLLLEKGNDISKSIEIPFNKLGGIWKKPVFNKKYKMIFSAFRGHLNNSCETDIVGLNITNGNIKYYNPKEMNNFCNTLIIQTEGNYLYSSANNNGYTIITKMDIISGKTVAFYRFEGVGGSEFVVDNDVIYAESYEMANINEEENWFNFYIHKYDFKNKNVSKYNLFSKPQKRTLSDLTNTQDYIVARVD